MHHPSIIDSSWKLETCSPFHLLQVAQYVKYVIFWYLIWSAAFPGSFAGVYFFQADQLSWSSSQRLWSSEHVLQKILLLVYA